MPIAPWPWRERTKTARSRRSNDHQLRLPIQPGVPDHLLRTAPGTWPPSFFSPFAVQLRCGWRPFLKLTRRARGETNVVSIASCAPRHKLKPSATSNLRPSKALNSPRSMSLTHTFVATRAPASRQICAAAHSKGNSLLPNTPVSTRCAMVAKHVELTATSAGAQSEGKGQVEAEAKQEVERLRVEPGDPGRRESREWC